MKKSRKNQGKSGKNQGKKHNINSFALLNPQQILKPEDNHQPESCFGDKSWTLTKRKTKNNHNDGSHKKNGSKKLKTENNMS